MELLTLRKLKEKAECDPHYTGLEEYQVLFHAISKYHFTRFISLTTTLPLTDTIVADDICRRLCRYFSRMFYGRQKSKMAFISIVEKHKELRNGQPRLHIHILMGEPKGAYRLHSELQDKLMTSFLFGQIIHKISFGANGRGRLGKPDIKDVTTKQELIDYCLKEIDSKRLHIAWEGTNIDFSDMEMWTICTAGNLT